MVYSNTAVYGGKLVYMINPVTCFFNTFLKHFFHDAFEVQFFRASFLHLIKGTDSMWAHASQIFKVKTLLNDAFK